MRKRRYAYILVVIAILANLVFVACSSDVKLSEMDDDELMQYLEDADVTLPQGFEAENIRGMITELEEDPNHAAPVVSWSVISDLYEDLRTVVKEYYK